MSSHCVRGSLVDEVDVVEKWTLRAHSHVLGGYLW